METIQASPKATRTSTPARGRTALDFVMLAGTFGPGAVYAIVLAITGHIIPPVLIFMSLYLISGIIVATGWRWAFFFPLVLCTLGVVGELAAGYPLYVLGHPSANYLAFTGFAINYPLLVSAIIAAAVKLTQTLRREAPHLPRWMVPVLGAAPGLMLGALAIGLGAQPTSMGSAAAAPAGTETVHLAASSFAPNIVALHAGDKLAIVDDAPVPHTLTNGTWSADNRPVPGVEPGAVILNNLQLNNNSVTVGPFTTPGTYHIYCTVHPGMSLTIIVQ